MRSRHGGREADGPDSRRAGAATSGRAELRDAVVKGLVLRVTSGGARSWSVQSVLHGQKVRLTLGQYPALGLAEARRMAQQALRDLALGGDPRAEQGGDQGEPDPGRAGRRVRGPGLPRLKARAGHRQGETVRSAKERLRLLRGYLGGLSRRKVVDLTRRDLVMALDEAERHGAVTRNRVLTALSALLGFAVRRGVIEDNPALGVARLPERSRERALSAEELARLWRALDGLPVARATALALKLVICTGVRPGEAAGARWAELEGALWTIPAERTKSARPHAVPLPPLAQEILAEARGLGGARTCSRPPRRPGEPIRRLSLSQASGAGAGQPQAAALGVSDLRPHDLRGAWRPGSRRSGCSRTWSRRCWATPAGTGRGSPGSTTGTLTCPRRPTRWRGGPTGSPASSRMPTEELIRWAGAPSPRSRPRSRTCGGKPASTS
jgi:integrase